jgi:hypothetical protein
MAKQVPAHRPSPADPIAAGVAALFALVALFGLDLHNYVTAEEAIAIVLSIVTAAATVRTVWQRSVAQ